MRVLVLGASGMLGHKMYQILDEEFETWGTVRASPQDYEHLGIFRPDRLIGGVEVETMASVEAAVDRAAPDVLVNCVGIVKQLPGARDAALSISINSLLPHRLESLCLERGMRLVHISTDCVFSGARGSYSEDDVPDARDLYGRSKLLGEVAGPPSLTVRTSIIGREILSAHGLVEWFLAQSGPRVPGFTRAIFSGLPTVVLARVIAETLRKHPDLSGLYHISADPISKYDLLLLLRDAYHKPVEIEPCSDVDVDRSLLSNRFRERTGYRPESWPCMVELMIADPTPYDQLRKVHCVSR